MISNEKDILESDSFLHFLDVLISYGDIVKDIYPKKDFDLYFNIAIKNNLYIQKKSLVLRSYSQCINFEWIRYYLLYQNSGNINKTVKEAFISKETLKKILNTKKRCFSNEIETNFNFKKLYDSIFEVEELLNNLNEKCNQLKIAFLGSDLLLVQYVDNFISNHGDVISKSFFDYDTLIKSLENNQYDLGICIVDFIPQSEKIYVLKKYVDDLYIIKSKKKSSHFIDIIESQRLNNLEKYSKFSFVQDSETRLIFALNTSSDTLLRCSNLKHYKHLIDKDNFEILLYNEKSINIFIIKNKTKILNKLEKKFIKGFSEKLKEYDVREKV